MNLYPLGLTVSRDGAAIIVRHEGRLVFAGTAEDALKEVGRMEKPAADEVRRLAAIAEEWRGG